ncbi:MAG TPA: carboxypeptidase M32 [Phycisphaerales bacterium]|nr:carboxypeptidase M32 [Phycisphaerales bacterium]
MAKRAKRTSKRTGISAGGTGGAGAYDALMKELREVATLGSVASLIGWDQETYMPAAGAGLRAGQREMLSGMIHERRTSKKIGDLIRACESSAAVRRDAKKSANIREARRDYDRATKLPRSLVEEMARTSALGMDAWKDAKQESNFKKFLPWLQKTVELNREKAKCYGVPKGGEHYDALLDEFEPGMTAKKTEMIFGPLRAELVPLIERAASAKKKPDERPARVVLPIEQQKEFATKVAAQFGFDFNAGRMDVSSHPFCDGVGPGDTRMTNRYRPDGWCDALSSATHEGGHGMYEQGLPKEKMFGQPLAEAVSLGIHESQSRLWENLVGRSQPFWQWGIKLAREVFGAPVRKLSADDVYRAANVVRPNFIRVESDELTYNLHIMLRFDLERAMLRGDLSCRDLPGVWNARIKSDLGLKVPDDRRGCLQDIHWSMGALGYFPTYTFGNLFAAQFWEAIGRDIKNRDARMAKGDYAPILQWLREKIHRHGRMYSANELCERATGKPLTHAALIRHLTAKVENVYG